MIKAAYFFTTEDKVISLYYLLQKEFNLVGAIEDNRVPRKIEDERGGAVLVAEDESGEGIFRLKFAKAGLHRSGPYVGCMYWTHRMTPEIRKRDPMKPIVKRVYQYAQSSKIINTEGRKLDIERLLTES